MAKKLNKEGQAILQSKNDKMFYFVKDENGKIHICVGGYAVSENMFDTFDQAERYIEQKPWDIIVNLCYMFLTKKYYETKDENSQDK